MGTGGVAYPRGMVSDGTLPLRDSSGAREESMLKGEKVYYGAQWNIFAR